VKTAKQYNIHEAKTHFSKLVERAHEGEEIIISRAGEPLVRLVPIGRPVRKRVPGTAAGLVRMERGFEAPLPKKIRKLFLS
jgi:prevent-host-death family protein